MTDEKTKTGGEKPQTMSSSFRRIPVTPRTVPSAQGEKATERDILARILYNMSVSQTEMTVLVRKFMDETPSDTPDVLAALFAFKSDDWVKAEETKAPEPTKTESPAKEAPATSDRVNISPEDLAKGWTAGAGPTPTGTTTVKNDDDSVDQSTTA